MSKIKNILSLGIFTILSGAINYATYPILMRQLSLSDFAEFSVFANLITLFAIPALGFGYYILILVQRSPEDIRGQKSRWMHTLSLYSILYVCTIGISLFLLQHFLELESSLSIMLISCLGAIFLFASFFASILQARERFILLGILGVI
jgi:O-antigen/teichoic acid export membrane protein